MSEFYLPYQFIPVTGNPKSTTLWDAIDNVGNEHSVRHDLWLKRTHSGRIVCRLRLETPTLVGGGREENAGQVPRLKPYFRDGRPAIPANSLRGMISAVAEAISQSSLRVLGEEFWIFFRSINPSCVPLTPDRNELTPAEILFGAVDQVNETNGNQGGRALASRLRFSDALFLGTEVNYALSNWKTIRTLGSPKPLEVPDGHRDNTPSTYFYPKGGRQGDEVIKKSISGDIHLPNGRKFYLRHLSRSMTSENKWTKTDGDLAHDQQIRPLQAGQEFIFHIDFDNLSDAEVDLFLISLEPGDGFLHQIGVGKSLGLGAVSLIVEGIFFIDRSHRYSAAGLTAERYHRVWHHATHLPDIPEHERYQLERQALTSDTVEQTNAWALGEFERLIDENTLKQLLLIGIPPSASAAPIRWRRGHQGESAQPLPPIDDELPSIKSSRPYRR